MRLSTLLIVLCVAAPLAAAPPLIVVHATCIDRQVVVHVDATDSGSDDAQTRLGLRIYAQPIGVCGKSRLVNAELLPWPGVHDVIDVDAVVALGATYFVRTIDARGVEQPAGSAIAGCGSWVLARGTLQLGERWQDGILQLEPCPDTCWFEPLILDATALEPATYLPLVGKVVDVSGAPIVDGAVVTSISTAVDGCGPAVGDRVMSWDAVKTLYQ